jgi:egghead protein (zeste-white 4 protein)
VRHAKHVVHCVFLLVFVVTFVWFSLRTLNDELSNNFDPFDRYGVLVTLFLYFCRVIPLCALPNVVFNLAGQVLFCIFPRGFVPFRSKPDVPPHLRIRVVTRGDFPELVKRNVARNIATCVRAGVPDFAVEVVTDRPVRIPPSSQHPHVVVREIVVPASYQPKSGALFKVRVKLDGFFFSRYGTSWTMNSKV